MSLSPPLSRRLLIAGALSISWPAWARAAPAAAGALDFEAFNAARDTPVLQQGSRGAAVARAQILLDRAWFSPGEIDGLYGSNLQRMVRAWQRAQGLTDTGAIDAATWQALYQASPGAYLVRYRVTEQDAAGPFEKTPADMAARAALKASPYESLEEALAERFHLSPAWLRQLNPGVKLTAGAELALPNVLDSAPPTRASQRLEIDPRERVLSVLDNAGRPVAAFPISIGTPPSQPLPRGRLAIRNAVERPSYTHPPAGLERAPKDAPRLEIAPGPNNPVGTVWLGLTQPHWGIHGTPQPSRVGHGGGDGFIHLTNWDAERLARLVKVGARVDVKD